MSRDERMGKAAYEKFRELFKTGDLTWEELEGPKEKPARTQEKWIAIGRAASEVAPHE